MSEPTKEQIEEANTLAEKYGIEGRDWDERHDARLALMLADVRKQARDEAIDQARDIVDCVRFTTTAPEYEGETVEEAAQEMMRQIVALKDQPTG